VLGAISEFDKAMTERSRVRAAILALRYLRMLGH
jgi:hypothetical protein